MDMGWAWVWIDRTFSAWAWEGVYNGMGKGFAGSWAGDSRDMGIGQGFTRT